MNSKKQPASSMKLSSADVLEALGLERRQSRGKNLLAAIGLAVGGIIVGAGAVLLRAGVLSLSSRKATEPTS